jgi:hypothetical protein
MDLIITILGIIFALTASGALALVILFVKCDLVAAEEERKRNHEKQENH